MSSWVAKNGKALQSFAESLAELTQQANEFSHKRLPVLKALGIA